MHRQKQLHQQARCTLKCINVSILIHHYLLGVLLLTLPPTDVTWFCPAHPYFKSILPLSIWQSHFTNSPSSSYSYSSSSLFQKPKAHVDGQLDKRDSTACIALAGGISSPILQIHPNAEKIFHDPLVSAFTILLSTTFSLSLSLSLSLFCYFTSRSGCTFCSWVFFSNSDSAFLFHISLFPSYFPSLSLAISLISLKSKQLTWFCYLGLFNGQREKKLTHALVLLFN